MTTQAPSRVALVGCGATADWHALALQAAGLSLSAVCARQGSLRLGEFAMRHGVERTFEDTAALAASKDWDGAVVVTPAESLAQVAHQLLATGRPVLIEKPVALASARFEELRSFEDQIMVGYNRRFYSTVGALRDSVRRGAPVVAGLRLPEKALDSSHTTNDYLRPFFANGVHALDLVRFVFGEVALVSTETVLGGDGRTLGVASILRSARGDAISLQASWGAPENFGLTATRQGYRGVLEPFEALREYEGMDVVNAGPDSPFKRYRPREVSRLLVESRDGQKPGFVEQALAFRGLLRGVPSVQAAQLSDARRAIELAEAVIGQTLESSERVQ